MLNVEAFLNTQTDQALDTSLPPVPVGEYKAISEPLDKDSFSTFDYKKGERTGQKGYRLTLYWKIDDEAAGPDFNGRKVRQQFIVDVTADGNGLDFGKHKNIDLGKLREALGQNSVGQPWAPSMLGQQVAKIKTKQTFDQQDPAKVYSEVASVAKL